LAQPDWNLLAFGRVEKLVDSTRAQSGRATRVAGTIKTSAGNHVDFYD
jgi:hypothetical protein